MAIVNEDHVQQAIRDYERALYPSLRAAARAYGLTHSTVLRRYHQCTVPRRVAREPQRWLSDEQEQMTRDWILYCERCGYPISHAQLREFAGVLTSSTGGPTRVGANWVLRFLQRHPELRTKIGRKIDSQRVNNTSPDNITRWFTDLASLKASKGIVPHNIYNMDETGIALGVCNNSRVIGNAHKSKTYIKSPENREWVSIIECISATGAKLRPVVVFKGQNLQSTWLPDKEVPDWLYTTSTNGWTSNEIGTRWLEEVFLKETSQQSSNSLQTRLLLIDGHGSHATVDFMRICWLNNIYAYYLIPHSSHVLQPLDLCPFSILKSRYRHQIAELARFEDSLPVKKIRFVQYYKKARDEALNEYNIAAGWKATGLHPWDPRKVIRSSQVTQISRDAINKPQTPPKQVVQVQPGLSIITPANTRQARAQFESIQRASQMTRTVRVLFNKTKKRMSQLEFQNAQNTIRIERQNRVITDLQVKRRKKVTIDANARFARIEDIVRAQEAIQEAQETWDKQDRARMARKQVNDLIEIGIKPLLHCWHVVDGSERVISD